MAAPKSPAPTATWRRCSSSLGKPVSLAVNKMDTAAQREALANEFYELGIADVFPISSEHGTGVDALLDRVTEGFPRPTGEETEAAR